MANDSLIFNTQYRLKISGNQNDNVTGNDTFSVPTIFSNYYAYDDGTAEGGYGIKQKTNVGANLKYKLEDPDSIVGVYIFFNQSEQNVSTQRFQLKVWKSISPLFEPATKDVVLYTQDVSKPTYTNAINGLAVVAIQRDACGGCFNKIPPQRQMDLRLRKKIIVCEYCGRILVDPEIATETEIA